MARSPMAFDYEQFDQLKAELGSENKAFQAMGVSRGSGQRALKRRQQGLATPPAIEVLPAHPPLPYHDEVPAVLDDIKGDLVEMALWWRERKLRQTQPRRPREMVRWTIHIDRGWRDRIMELSDAQRTSIADVVDDICRAYFERTL